MLLSVSPLNSDAILINQTFGKAISTTVGKAVATADNGDFVATWSQTDNVLDAAGNPITINGNPLTQSDVWARYFTQEVQRITLPTSIANNNDDDPNTVGRFSLTYNTQTIQEISFSAGTAPAYDGNIEDFFPMQGYYTLWFDANGNGKVDPGEQATLPFDETQPAASAAVIQAWLRSFTPVPGVSDTSHVIVTATDPDNYLIDFGTATAGLAQPQIQWQNPDVVKSATFSFTGFLPAVTVNTLEIPFTITGIPVSQTDPQQTCTAIETWFQQAVTYFTTSESPVWFQGGNGVAGGNPYSSPIGPLTGFEPSLSVQPVVGSDGVASLTQFDITFGGTSSYRDEAPLVIGSAVDENGDPMDLSQSKGTILKESSPEFQVNSPTQESLFSLNPVVYNAGQSAVAADATGDFVITWSATSEIKGSGTDIYARRFTPIGITASYAPGTYVPGQITTGVEVLPSPSAVDVQQLNFSATGALPVTGLFQLQMATELGPVTTGNITFTTPVRAPRL